jgi:hypothetical protein
MKTIGFANKFYTLWEVGSPYRKYVNEHTFFMAIDYTYFKNLSFDLDKAKEKMGESDYNIDLNLKGSQSWTYEDKGNMIFDRSKVSDYIIPDGIKGAGRDIRKMGLGEDISQNQKAIKMLWGVYLKKDIWNNEVFEHSFRKLNPHWVRPCVYARRQLINLGIIEKYKGQYVTEKYKLILIEKEHISNLENGHFFENKEKIEIEVKVCSAFSFEGMYGLTHIISYETKCGKLLKYMGASPKAGIYDDVFTKIKATVKHGEYKGESDTKLQRISLI